MRWPLRTYLFRGGTWLALVIGASFASLSLLVFTDGGSNLPSGIALPPGASQPASEPEGDGSAADEGLVAATTPSSPAGSVATLAQVTPVDTGSASATPPGATPPAPGGDTPGPGGGGDNGGDNPGPDGDQGGPVSPPQSPPDNPTPKEPPAKPPSPAPPVAPPSDDDDRDDDDKDCDQGHDDSRDWDDDDWDDDDHHDDDWDDDHGWDDDPEDKGGNGNHYGWSKNHGSKH
jgi:hypothetical protein